MRTDTHAIKRSTQETMRTRLVSRGVNEKEAEAHAEATAEATVEAIVMSQQDLVTKQDLELTTEKLRTEMADLRAEMKADNAELRTEMKTDNEKLRTEVKTDIAEFRAEVKTDIAELRTEIARGNLKTVLNIMAIMAFLNTTIFALLAYYIQLKFAPLPLPGNQVQESQQIERRIEQPEPRV